MKKVLVFLLFFFMALLIILTAFSREFLLPKETEKKIVRAVVHPGMRAGEISSALEQQEVIRNAWSFNLLMRLTKTGGKIVAGTYDLSPSMSEYEILKALVEGRGVLVRVTIPEGFTLRQIARLLASKEIVKEDDFLAYASHAALEFPEVEGKIEGLEGFLFPDTYDLQPNVGNEDAVKPMLQRFQELAVPRFLQGKSQLDLLQIITLASMIEREGKVLKELPVIAAVYYNRLKDHMPLQCDATLQYLLPNPKEFLTEEDLKIDSPYNTYMHAGLPPGPIGNPGLAAIRAALHPAHVRYRYYVLAGKDGHHTFSVTYPEHLHAIREYQQWLLHRKRG